MRSVFVSIRRLSTIVAIVWLFFVGHFTRAADEEAKCGRACHNLDPEKINIHLIPHTHNDVGWLKTVDQYYYGSNKGHAPYGVQYILDSIISELHKNATRRFVYAETGYFYRWWKDADDGEKAMVRKLVRDGQLEFVHGGWCMSDEATPHYSAMIDQMTLGLKFLNDTFENCGRPKVSWQIDPFGHSSEVAIEFAEMGFDGLFVGRIDFEDADARKAAKEMEMVWRPEPSLNEAGELFTSVLYDLYTSPAGFCFDTYCSDEPIMDDKKLHGFNVDERIKRFEEHMDRYRTAFKTKNVLVTMGGDFTYSVASSWFKNMDKLIKYINGNRTGTYNLLYSTPYCYLKAINSLDLTWPAKENDDFFPYGSDKHSYWTGYYTSRPALKYMVYKAQNVLVVTKQLATLLGNELMLEEEEKFKEAVGIAQHHDAVSGTEKQHVSDDYALYLYEGLQAGVKVIETSYNSSRLYGFDYPQNQSLCILRNISECAISEEGQNFVITVYNPLSRKVSVPIRFPTMGNVQLQVYKHDGSAVEQDVIPIPKAIMNVPLRRSNATNDLEFLAKDLPACGVTNYYVQVASLGETSKLANDLKIENETLVLDNGLIKLTFNKTDGMLRSVTKNSTTWPFHQNFYYYLAMKGYNYNADSRASGAYIFRPAEKDVPPKIVSSTANITAQYNGKNVFEVHQQFSSWLTQIVRLRKGSEDIEFLWYIDSVPIQEWTGMEVVTKYTTDVVSQNTFYTDSNGRRWMKRTRDHRKYWNLTTTEEPFSINYYPLTTSICIRDGQKQMTVITDRPQGGTSMKSGELEIMLHRRLLYDDNKGVVEPLDETVMGRGLVVRGTHIVQLNQLGVADTAHRLKVAETVYAPVPTFAKTHLKLNEWSSKFNKNFTLLTFDLPVNVHILTLERWRTDQILLRLEHIFQPEENSTFARPIDVNFTELFTYFKVNKFEELTLAANQPKKELNRLKWKYEGGGGVSKKTEKKSINPITILPMQIKTFLLDVESKSTKV